MWHHRSGIAAPTVSRLFVYSCYAYACTWNETRGAAVSSPRSFRYPMCAFAFHGPARTYVRCRGCSG